MKQTGEEYRLANRKRLQKFYERHEAQGKRRVSALISGAAYDLMMAAKDSTGASISHLVDKALVDTFTAQVEDTAAQVTAVEPVTTTEAQEIPDPVQVDQIPDPVTDAQADQVTAQADEKKKRALQILEIEKQYPGRKNAQARADAMNDAGILKKGAACQWDKISTKNAILGARKTLGIK